MITPADCARQRIQSRFVTIAATSLFCTCSWYHPLVGVLPEDGDSGGGSETTLTLLLAVAFAPGNSEIPFSVRSESVGGEPTAVHCGANYFYVAGIQAAGGSNAWRIEKRHKQTGALDPAFGSGGVVTVDPHPTLDDDLSDLVSDGTFLYAVGIDRTGTGSTPQWRIEKRLASTGALVSTFGTGGVVQEDPFVGQDDFLHAAALTSGGLLLAGSTSTGSTLQQWRLELRDSTSGALLPSFNGTGVRDIATNNGTLTRAYDLAIDENFMYLAGADRAANVQWRIDKRNLADGSAVTAFDGDGQWLVNPGSGPDTAQSIAIDASAVYFSGSNSDTNNPIRVDKVDITSGAAVSAFDGDGSYILDVSNAAGGLGDDRVAKLLIDGGTLYGVGWDSGVSSSDQQWRIALYDSATAAPVTSFAANGVLQINPTASNDRATAACIAGDFLYVAGLESATLNHWRIDKRYKASGQL